MFIRCILSVCNSSLGCLNDVCIYGNYKTTDIRGCMEGAINNVPNAVHRAKYVKDAFGFCSMWYQAPHLLGVLR